jgi:hypothetical protein
MACLAGHVQVGIAGDLLVVPNMTRKAVSLPLIGMPVLGRIRMTDEARDLAVRGRRICGHVDQRGP